MAQANMTEHEVGRRSEIKEKGPELHSTIALQSLLDTPSVLDELSRCLDKEMKIIPYWRHLARELGVPSEVIKRFEVYTDYSPTARMFSYLQATRPDCTMGDLNAALKSIYRMDLILLISKKSGCNEPQEKIHETFDKNGKLFESICMELDSPRHNFGSWRQLGSELQIRGNILNQFEMYSTQSPTNMLFRVLRSARPTITIKELKTKLFKMERKDVVEILNKYSVKDSSLVAYSLKLDSDVLHEIEERLNLSIHGIGNWRSLAFQLGISCDIYDNFEFSCPDQFTKQSPTKLMLKWLVESRKSATICNVIEGLEKIERRDAIKVLNKSFNVIDSCEKRNERFFTSADGLAAFALELEGGEPDKTCTVTMQNVRNEKKPGQERAVSSSSNATEAANSYRGKIRCALHMSLELVLPEYQRSLGDHPYTATALNSIGYCYGELGDYEKAVKYTQQALSMRKMLLEDHQDTARSYYDLGVALEGQGLYEDALENLKRAAEIQDKVLDTHEETVKSHQEIAFVLNVLGRETEAMDARSLAEEIFRKLPKTCTSNKNNQNLCTTEPIDFRS